MLWSHITDDNNKCLTLVEVGEILNIYGEHTRRIENKALSKIWQSKWAKLKAIEIYGQKKRDNNYSITGTLGSISFAERYLRGDI